MKIQAAEFITQKNAYSVSELVESLPFLDPTGRVT